MNRAIILVIFLFAGILFLALNQSGDNSGSQNKLTKSDSYHNPKKFTKLLTPQELSHKSLEDQAEYQKMLDSDAEFNQALTNLQQELITDSGGNSEKKGESLDLSKTEGTQDLKPSFVSDKLPSNTQPSYFELTPAEIKALNNSGTPNSNLGLIGGIHNRTAGAVSPVASPKDEGQTPAEAFQGLPQVTGQPRGYLMLYLMHPGARATVNAQVEGLVVSGIRNLYLSVLIDGTFGNDFEFLKSNIKKLSDHCDSLTLVLYLSNGSTMRRWNLTDIEAGFNKIEPKVFRELIQSEDRAKNEFRAIVRDAESVFAYNSGLSLDNKNIAIVMLEDNLQKQSYLAMRNLAKDILGDRVEYMRNPCPGCYPGNDIETDGDALEIHDPEGVFEMNAGEGFTNDGVGYRFASEPQAADRILIDDLEARMLTADSRGSKYFGLFRSERQGYTSPPIHPDNRSYEVPTVKQLVTEIRMLRSGLVEVKQ